MIVLPDIRQTNDHSCGMAAVMAVCYYWGVADPPDLANPVQGMGPDTVEALLRSAGLQVLSGTFTIHDLRYLTRDRPVICPTQYEGGHWVTVRGITQWVYYQDPLYGPRHTGKTEWMAAWDDRGRLGHSYKHWGICGYK